MAAPESYKKSHLQILESAPAIKQKTSKSRCSKMLYKSLIIVSVIVVTPLFPSQAPDFITQKLLTNVWELLHLLFVGLALCYGLFCRKCVEMESEICCENDTEIANFSGVLCFPSISEDGFESLCISDESNILLDYKDSLRFDEGKKLRSFSLRNENEPVCDNRREKGSQIWNSQYFKGENLMVVSDGNYEYNNDYKSLGLPIRNLRSGVSEISEFSYRNEDTSVLKMSDISEREVERLVGSVPSNLEKFKEVARPSAIPWISRSERMELEEIRNAESQAAQCRPHSAGEFEFEHLQLGESHDPVSFHSHSTSLSRSSITSCVSSEDSNLKLENLETGIDSADPFGSVLEPSVHGRASSTLNSFEGSSIGSSSEMEIWQRSENSFDNVKRKVHDQQAEANQRRVSSVKSSDSFENLKNKVQDQHGEASQRRVASAKSSDNFENLKKDTMQDQLGGTRQRSETSNLRFKSSNLSRNPPRARSVRTIRPANKLKKAENNSHYTEDHDEAMFNHIEAPVLANSLKKREPGHRQVEKQKHNPDKVYPLPTSSVSQIETRGSQDFSDSAFPSEDDSVSDSVSDIFQEGSNGKDSGLSEVYDEELVGSEVDRKADEFIAKFREQIRLQKISSLKRY